MSYSANRMLIHVHCSCVIRKSTCSPMARIEASLTPILKSIVVAELYCMLIIHIIWMSLLCDQYCV